MRKLFHLQILRTVAASLVVVDHTLGIFSALGSLPRIYEKTGALLGDAGVAAFFALSGLILVRVSADEFSLPGARSRFIFRRLVRIVPMYWLTTLIYCLIFANAPRIGFAPHPQLGWQFLTSLAFLPNIWSTDMRMMPVAGQGWTLNYEMAFYCLLAFCLRWRRNIGVLLVILVPLGLASLGPSIHPASDTLTRLALVGTDPFLLLFSGGALIGWLELEMKDLPALHLPFSPALLLLLPAFVTVVFGERFGRMNLFPFFRFLGFVTVVLCAITTETEEGWFNRLLVRFGDASYSTYLVHLLAVIPVGFAAKFASVHGWLLGPFLVLAVMGANYVGFATHIVIERRLTDMSRRFGAMIASRWVVQG